MAKYQTRADRYRRQGGGSGDQPATEEAPPIEEPTQAPVMSTPAETPSTGDKSGLIFLERNGRVYVTSDAIAAALEVDYNEVCVAFDDVWSRAGNDKQQDVVFVQRSGYLAGRLDVLDSHYEVTSEGLKQISGPFDRKKFAALLKEVEAAQLFHAQRTSPRGFADMTPEQALEAFTKHPQLLAGILKEHTALRQFVNKTGTDLHELLTEPSKVALPKRGRRRSQ